MESSKSLVLLWAKELDRLDLSIEVTKKALVEAEVTQMKNKDVCYTQHKFSLIHRHLDEVLPYLEFVVWSLLSQDTEEHVSKIWLPAKQREWKTTKQKYIPNSVWQWIQSASVNVHLDSNSCHPWLCVSENKQEVYELHEAPREQQLDSPEQFDKQPFVLGLNRFSSGRHYWEVNVPAKGSWRLGVAAASAQRKGRFNVAPGSGYWTICSRSETLHACTDPPTKLPNSVPLQVVGVYVDYEEGQVSFYNAKSRFQMYTFTQTFRDVLFPVFACLDGNTVLKISTL
ncbi:E3 ubiquitin-protein ligase TRIM21-like [Silurus meridionalis]|uniref:E3 ubiquitin-protein ligase TRIM21-like n=1 Tax=Silurus meridionalis TaxID=175797 RepID=UPI001EEADBC0|nr:E3 ubiquitin-protein ligase TRIM21-like [Silurus meridionalis]